jgi:ABC-type transport system substrate-binding protein
MEAAVNTTDPDERRAYYQDFQRVVMEDAPWVFLYQPVRAFPMQSRVQGFHIPPVEAFAWQYVTKN